MPGDLALGRHGAPLVQRGGPLGHHDAKVRPRVTAGVQVTERRDSSRCRTGVKKKSRSTTTSIAWTQRALGSGRLDAPGGAHYAADMTTATQRKLTAFVLALWLWIGVGFDVVRDERGASYRWPTQDVPVFVVLPKGGDVTGAALVKATRAAIETWMDADASELRLVYGGTTRSLPGFGISISLGLSGFDPRSGEPVGEVTTVVRDGSLARVDLRIDGEVWRFGAATSSADPRQRSDLPAVVTHLLGHAIGLTHSRDLRTTMGFWSVEADKRTLEEDDRAGVRHLYGGAQRTGAICDACDGDGDCAADARCLRWNDARSYCAPGCQRHDDCPVGWSCGAWKQGFACLPNTGHCSPDREKVAPSHACASDAACGDTLVCLVLQDTGLCTAGCTSFCGVNDEFGTCVAVQLGGTPVGLCLDMAGRKFGERCEGAADCGSLLCESNIAGGGTCSVPCSQGCPNGSTCGGNGACVLPGDGGLGYPCASGFDCASGTCVTTNGKGVCATECKLASDCPKGTGCTPTANGSFCLPYGPPPLGFPCATAGACGASALCVAEGPVGAICRKRCDPFGDSTDCEAGDRCVWHDGDGICRPAGGGEIPGAACDPATPCRIDLVCAGISPSSATCRADCAPDSGTGCTGSLSCVELQEEIAATATPRGVCGAEAGPLMVVPPSAVTGGKNFAARTIDGRKIGPWTPPEAEPPAEASGCSAAPGPHQRANTLPWLALAAVAVLTLRRRSTRAPLVEGGVGRHGWR